jgi:beta-N-acetylhexosaminidase
MLRNQIGQQMVIGLQGTTLSNEESTFISKNNIGGVILFKRNIESPQQLRDLSTSLQSLRKSTSDQAPLFISVDMEGGRVHRMKPPFTQWPALAYVGKLDSTSVAFRFAQAMGEELRAVGVNLDFAPCIDIFSNPANTVIGDRSLGGNAEAVARLGSALVRGYIKADIIPCAKHFPGHGNTRIDSHEALPIEDKSLEELDALELEPFKKIFRARLEMIMAAHIKYPKVDPEWPASLSEIFLKTVLRERLRYRGLIITDDLDMKALTANYDKATIAVRAIQAGANILLYCNEPESPAIALDAIEKAVKDGQLDSKVVSENQSKVLSLKKSKLVNLDPQKIEDVSRIVGHPDHLRLAKAIVDGSVPADLVAQAT